MEKTPTARTTSRTATGQTASNADANPGKRSGGRRKHQGSWRGILYASGILGPVNSLTVNRCCEVGLEPPECLPPRLPPAVPQESAGHLVRARVVARASQDPAHLSSDIAMFRLPQHESHVSLGRLPDPVDPPCIRFNSSEDSAEARAHNAAVFQSYGVKYGHQPAQASAASSSYTEWMVRPPPTRLQLESRGRAGTGAGRKRARQGQGQSAARPKGPSSDTVQLPVLPPGLRYAIDAIYAEQAWMRPGPPRQEVLAAMDAQARAAARR